MFFLPIGDTPNPRDFTPWLTWALIAANVLVYAFVSIPMDEAGTYGALILQRGFVPAEPEALDLFTSMFLHGGLAHLGGNLLFLWIFGDNVEHALGRVGFVLLYLGTGALATVAYAVIAGASEVPLIGASGAISGLLGVYFLLFAQNRVKIFVLVIPFYVGTVLVPVRLVLGFFVVVDNLLPFLLGAESGVAYGAHLGGFFAGLAVAGIGNALGWSLRKEPRDLVARARGGKTDERAAALLDLGWHWLERDQPTQAWQVFVRAREVATDPVLRRKAEEGLRRVEAHQKMLDRLGISDG